MVFSEPDVTTTGVELYVKRGSILGKMVTITETLLNPSNIYYSHYGFFRTRCDYHWSRINCTSKENQFWAKW